MAKFAGFTPEQQFILLQKQGYQGPQDPTEMDKFLQASPAAAASLGRYAEIAQKKIDSMPNAIGMVPNSTGQQPSTPAGFATGGYVAENRYKTQADWDLNAGLSPEQKANVAAHNPTRQGFATPAAAATVQDNTSNYITNTPDKYQNTQPNLQAGYITKANSATQGVAVAHPVQNASTVNQQQRTQAEQVDPTLVGDKLQTTLDGVQAAKAEPSAKATVRGQLEILMDDFEGGATPPWASGAMRQATALMQKRGLGASSVAGQAIVQAAMEAATGIAAADAQTNAQFEMQNLNNEQQTTIFKAQQMIAGMFTDQAQENAAKQFNAANKTQVDQFYASLESTVSQFNSAQINAIKQFNSAQASSTSQLNAQLSTDVSKFNASEANATQQFNIGQSNAMKQFNKQVEAQRDQFNATQSLVIAQANAKWRQDISLTNQKAQNEANMEFARQANGLTQQALDASC